MARPRSDEKRRAILEAALRVFAERGVGNTPTSAISEAAGVAEGSLFTYFKTKAELINELYLEMRRDFDRQLTDFPTEAEARIRLRYIWDKFLNLGIGQPERLTVMRQIRASGKLLKENEEAGAMILETLSATREALLEGGFARGSAGVYGAAAEGPCGGHDRVHSGSSRGRGRMPGDWVST